MKKNTAILIFILSLCNFAKAQNLVSNGDFELYSQCPPPSSSSITDISRATGWNNPSYGTPDYFNCSIVPNNLFGYQKDCIGGHGYAGEIINSSSSLNDNVREYIYTKLNNVLDIGHTYLLSTYVSCSDNSDYAAKIGLLLTNTPMSVNSADPIIANPQISSQIPLIDTINWMLIQDTFVANGSENYLTIGNFYTTASSDTVRIGSSNGSNSGYYYIDGVSVYDVTGGACNTYWDAGFNKYIFAGDSIRLGAINTDNSAYTWQNSAGGPTYLSSNTDARPWSTPSVTTTYYVTKTCPNNNVFYDTVTVFVQQTTGIKQITNDVSINMYPNPGNGAFSINYTLKQNVQVEITDVSGRLVGTYILPATNNQFEVRNEYLKDGVYFYRVVDSKNTVIKTGKIVVMQ